MRGTVTLSQTSHLQTPFSGSRMCHMMWVRKEPGRPELSWGECCARFQQLQWLCSVHHWWSEARCAKIVQNLSWLGKSRSDNSMQDGVQAGEGTYPELDIREVGTVFELFSWSQSRTRTVGAIFKELEPETFLRNWNRNNAILLTLCRNLEELKEPSDPKNRSSSNRSPHEL